MPTQTAPPRENRLAKTGINDLRRLLETYKDQIAMALPRHITPERMIRVALTAFSRTPLLGECSATSICGALVQASILGLEPDGMSGEAFLIPYWSTKAGGYECQMQPGYKGIVKLARNTGEYCTIDAQPVHEADEFEFEKGSVTYWKHKWDQRMTLEQRGPIYGYWGGFTLKEGGSNFEFMSVSEIDAHRDRYSQGAYKKERGKLVLDKDGKKILIGPWADSPDWMYRKTPLLQSLKLAPKSYQLRVAMTLAETGDAGMGQTFVDLPKELSAAPVDEPEPGGSSAEVPSIQTPQAKSTEQSPPPTGTLLITAVQARRLEEISEESGWRQKDMLAWLKGKYLIDSVSDIRVVDYDRIVELLRSGGDLPK